MKWKITYHNQKVIDEITRWPAKIKAKYLRIIDLLEEYGTDIGGVLIKSVGNGLFEIRIKAQEGIGRAFFCYQHGYEIIVLHAFIKKTQKIPRKEMEIALNRMKEIEL